MNQATLSSILKHPSAFVPTAMSLLAVGVVVAHIALVGTARQPDEGTAAYIWRLLMAGQLPIILFFAIRWLLQTRYALTVLAFQGAAARLTPMKGVKGGGRVCRWMISS
jgi:hypothetical protein